MAGRVNTTFTVNGTAFAPEITRGIFYYLPNKALERVGLVCKEWKLIAIEVLWERFARDRGLTEKPNDKERNIYKETLKREYCCFIRKTFFKFEWAASKLEDLKT